MKALTKTVFPSEEQTIFVEEDDTYGGAHVYKFEESLGFNNGKAEYQGTYQTISFVKKEEDGTILAGLQSEQLLIALIDRHEKLNARFPSEQNVVFIEHLKAALSLQEDRVRDRINRGVMGELKK